MCVAEIVGVARDSSESIVLVARLVLFPVVVVLSELLPDRAIIQRVSVLCRRSSTLPIPHGLHSTRTKQAFANTIIIASRKQTFVAKYDDESSFIGSAMVSLVENDTSFALFGALEEEKEVLHGLDENCFLGFSSSSTLLSRTYHLHNL